jgi:hypothetical protein
MGASQQYRQCARACARWAREAEKREDQEVLLDMAKAWANIALVEEDVVKQARKAFSEPKAKRPLHF